MEILVYTSENPGSPKWKLWINQQEKTNGHHGYLLSAT